MTQSEQRTKIAVLADDLTGAADTALAFHRAGFGCGITTSPRDVPRELARRPVVAVDMASRALAPAVAYLIAYGAAQNARQAGATLFKKVDSQLRGHPGLELAAAMDAHPDAVAIVAPSLPGMGRGVRDGVLSGLAGPDVALAQSFAALTGAPVFNWALTGRHQTQGWPTRLPPGSVVLADAVSQEDLDRVVATALKVPAPLIWVGSSGLALSLAGVLHAQGANGTTLGWGPPDAAGSQGRPGAGAGARPGVLVVAATREPVLRQQVEALRSEMGAKLCELDTADRRARSWLRDELAELSEYLERGRVVVLCATPAGDGAQERAEHAHVVVHAAAALVAACAPEGLVATGGQTAHDLLDALGERACDVLDEVEPGMPLLRTRRLGARLVTKAGSFGTPLSLVRAVAAVRDWRHRSRTG